MRKFIANLAATVIVASFFMSGLVQAQFKPGELGTPPAAWNTWHLSGSPGNKSTVVQIAFSAASLETVTFGYQMDYLWGFTLTGDCSVRARIDPTLLAAAQAMDTTKFMYIPAGSSFEINLAWSGFICKGVATGTMDGLAVGRVN